MEGNNFQNLNTTNFDPAQMAALTQTVIIVKLVLDNSPSIRSYVNDMNTAVDQVFLHELKTCHRKDDIVIGVTTFNDKVVHKTGFRPVTSINDGELEIMPSGNGTALYDAVLASMEQVIAYREDLENQGIEVRCCIYIITDGENNEGKQALPGISKIVDQLRGKEEWASSFTINMLGVGRDVNFREACVDMSLNPDTCLDTISSSAKEIRDHMGIVSKSISSSAGAATVNF